MTAPFLHFLSVFPTRFPDPSRYGICPDETIAFLPDQPRRFAIDKSTNKPNGSATTSRWHAAQQHGFETAWPCTTAAARPWSGLMRRIFPSNPDGKALRRCEASAARMVEASRLARKQHAIDPWSRAKSHRGATN
jgi:hypothetical protein